jgi:predicted amidohydrolase
MTTPSKHGVLLCTAVAIGFGMSTGHPLGIVAAAGMPLVCLATETRNATFRNTVGYYIASLWPAIPALDRYIGQSATFLAPVALWVISAIFLAVPWTIAWTSKRWHYLWRAPLALLATVVPPLGIIGLGSPVTATGYLLPGTGWDGLAVVALLPGVILSTQVLSIWRRCFVICFLTGFCTGATAHRLVFPQAEARPPAGWVAVSTNFGDVSKPFADFLAAQFIQKQANETEARVLIFPEAVVPRWSEATEAFWSQTLNRCRGQGQILLIGAGLPAKTGRLRDDREGLKELRSYDFGAAIDALSRIDTSRAIYGDTLPSDLIKSRQEPMDNALLAVGGEAATFYQRVPVPVGMWRPFSKTSVPLRLNGPGVFAVDHQRAAVLICYEQLLPFPILASMLQHPTVIIGISNTFWVNGTTIPRSQAASVRGWAKLFRLPYLLAVNS